MRRSNASKFIGLAAVTAVLSLSLFGGGAASAASQSVDITGLFEFNQCTAEAVELEGRLHIVTSTEPNPDGSFHVKVHTNTMGVEGTGFSSLETYRFNRGTNLMGEFDVLAGGSAHFVGHEEFIHPGEYGGFPVASEDDKHVHFNMVIGLDAVGNPVTTFIPEFECK